MWLEPCKQILTLQRHKRKKKLRHTVTLAHVFDRFFMFPPHRRREYYDTTHAVKVNYILLSKGLHVYLFLMPLVIYATTKITGVQSWSIFGCVWVGISVILSRFVIFTTSLHKHNTYLKLLSRLPTSGFTPPAVRHSAVILISNPT